MRRGSNQESGIFTPRFVLAATIASAGILLGLLSVTASPSRPSSITAGVSPLPTWAMFTAPNMTDQGFNAVNCVSASDCWAVGSYNDQNFVAHTLTEHWNGTSWSLIASPNVNTTQDNVLNAVTCSSTSDCWAVGTYTTATASPVQQTLVLHWTAGAWVIAASPNSSTTQQNFLSAVTCASSTDCWVVGFHGVAGNALQTLIEHWNGAAWSISTSANTNAAAANLLSGVTCTASTNCWTVGSYDAGGGVQQTLIERWNGTTWAIVASPNTSTLKTNTLNNVACASSSECSAVGYFDNGSVFQTLILRWTGSAWAVVSSPDSDPGEQNFLYGVACTSATNCWAVGSFINGDGTDRTMIQRWNGASWSVVSSPNTSPTMSNRLEAVACSSASDCWAVGTANYSFDQTLTVHWNNSAWLQIASANTGATNTFNSNVLNAVTCSGPLDCWAVGNFDPGTGIVQTLIEHWNGSTWSIIDSPDSDFFQPNELFGVSCTSSANCWATGYSVVSGTYRTLAEHWDGNLWTIVPSANTAPNIDNVLMAVNCVSSSQCWAVGYYIANGTTDQTLIEKWDGVSWSIVASPNSNAAQTNLLSAVTCNGASDCWAVGIGGVSGTDQTLTVHWNGSAWSTIPSPNTSALQHNDLNSVTCSSSANCWTVGQYSVGSVAHTLVLVWNGASWAIMTSPNTNNTDSNSLNSVTCVAGYDCTAVGSSGNSSLIERWNGTAWSILSSPNVAGAVTYLTGVACAPGADCWSVGVSNTSNTLQTVIEKRTAPLLGITAISRPTSGATAGHFIITGQAVATGNVNIYATQNPANGYTFLASVTANASGVFTYDDAAAVSINPPRRIYQVRYP